MLGQQIENIVTINTHVWIAVMKDGRHVDIFDKELDLLRNPADVAFVSRYREWATKNQERPAVPLKRQERAPTPIPFLRRLFSGLF
jgi:hypothetical protein